MTQPNFYTHKLAAASAVLAPMAGFSDAPFRRLCRRYGSAWAVTEMVSAKALVLGEGRGLEIGAPYPDEPDLVIQVFGGEPEIVAAGGRILFERYRPAALDLNMGCPVKKIVNGIAYTQSGEEFRRLLVCTAAHRPDQLVEPVPSLCRFSHLGLEIFRPCHAVCHFIRAFHALFSAELAR